MDISAHSSASAALERNEREVGSSRGHDGIGAKSTHAADAGAEETWEEEEEGGVVKGEDGTTDKTLSILLLGVPDDVLGLIWGSWIPSLS